MSVAQPGAAKRTRKPKAAPTEEGIVAYKGFDQNLACRGFQYEIGGTYEHKGRVAACESGFHSVECPFDAFNYYPAQSSRYAVVRASGAIERHEGDSKIASGKIYIEAELKLPEFIKAGVQWLLAHAKTKMATGDRGHAAATGDSGHAAATGDSGHAAATGYRGHAAATGDSGHAAATGDSGHAAATGDSGHAAATGYRGHAAATGKSSIAASLGPFGTAKAVEGGAISLAYYDTGVWPYVLKHVASFMVGQGGVEAGKTYRLNAHGKPEKVAL